MTKHAQKVLEDCKKTFAEFEPNLEGIYWRKKYILIIVLLRAVGHVLKKVDANTSEVLRLSIDKWWANLTQQKEPEIFWKFIEIERNNIVKEYKSEAVQITHLIPFTNSKNQRIQHIMDSGFFKGRSQHELIQEAIDWWEQQLIEIQKSTSI